MNYRCPPGNLQPTKPDAESVKRNGWHEHGILVVSKDDERLGWEQKEQVRRLGEFLFGKEQRG